MRLAALVYVRKEWDFLPLWLKHYSTQVDEMFVINPEHDKYPGKFTEILTDGFGEGHGGIPWGMEIINNMIKDLLTRFEWVVFSDADEYVIPKCGDLKAFLKFKHEAMFTCNGYELLQMPGEPPIDLHDPIFNQRSKWVSSNAYCKTILTRVPIILEPGGHYTKEMADESGETDTYKSKIVDKYITPDLYLVHLKRCDRHLFEAKGSRLGEDYWNADLARAEDLPTWIKDRL